MLDILVSFHIYIYMFIWPKETCTCIINFHIINLYMWIDASIFLLGLLQEFGTTGYCGGTSKLDWQTRLRIALEAAKGLEYLHEHVTPPVIHRDFKTRNILLDQKFHAKVSYFGLAKLGSEIAGGHVSKRVLGTQGYVASEYEPIPDIFRSIY